jgi:hypothetical protein
MIRETDARPAMSARIASMNAVIAASSAAGRASAGLQRSRYFALRGFGKSGESRKPSSTPSGRNVVPSSTSGNVMSTSIPSFPWRGASSIRTSMGPTAPATSVGG